MSDHLDRSAEVIAPIIADATACGYDFEGACDTCRADSALIVKALDAAGLLVSPERDAAVAVKALREAADDMDDTDDPDAIHVYNGDIDKWLRARADRIEREAGDRSLLTNTQEPETKMLTIYRTTADSVTWSIDGLSRHTCTADYLAWQKEGLVRTGGDERGRVRVMGRLLDESQIDTLIAAIKAGG